MEQRGLWVLGFGGGVERLGATPSCACNSTMDVVAGVPMSCRAVAIKEKRFSGIPYNHQLEGHLPVRG